MILNKESTLMKWRGVLACGFCSHIRSNACFNPKFDYNKQCINFNLDKTLNAHALDMWYEMNGDMEECGVWEVENEVPNDNAE